MDIEDNDGDELASNQLCEGLQIVMNKYCNDPTAGEREMKYIWSMRGEHYRRSGKILNNETAPGACAETSLGIISCCILVVLPEVVVWLLSTAFQLFDGESSEKFQK